MSDLRHRPGPRRGAALAALSAVLLTLALAAAPAAAAPRRSPLPARTLEARYGLRVTRVAVVGGGGMVDLRFQVVDAAKARRLLGAAHAAPTVRALPSRAVLSAGHASPRHVALRDGEACFVVFPNSGGALRPGGRAAVRFGSVELQPIAVQ